MHSSLLSALFLVSSVLATFTPPPTANPTNTVNNNPVPPTTNPAPTANPAGTIPVLNPPGGNSTDADPLANLTVVQSACPSLYLALSERDIAEISSTNITEADLNKLNTTKEGVFCMDKNVSVVCSIASCTGVFPTCQGCNEYTLDATGKGSLSPNVTDNVVCEGNYNFNATAGNETPYLCGTKDYKEFSCKSCVGFRSCDQCYNPDQIPNPDQPNPPTTNPQTTNPPTANPQTTNPQNPTPPTTNP